MERLQKHFDPSEYHLDLTIDRGQESISGIVRIDGKAHGKNIKLHAHDLNITKITQVAGDASLPLSFIQKDDIVTISLGKAVTTPISIVVEYTTSLNRDMQSCYLATFTHKGKEERIAATQFESHYARECFPCIDEPAAKAVFNLSITVPDFKKGDVVLANTELESSADNRFTFKPTPRMSTYLLAWVIGQFHSVSTVNKNGVKVTTYGTINHPKDNLTFANQVAARSLEYYDTKFGVKYPLDKLDQVAIPDFEAGAMENWGLVTYRESMMLSAPSASLSTRRCVAVTVAHELSHQWFGNLVTMEWWDDLWLNESFATIMEYYCVDALYPELTVWEDFFTGDCVAALRRDALPGVQAVKQDVKSPAEIATLFDSAIVYAKGARLILMLIRLMGEEKFDSGIQDYFKKHAYKNTIGDDLWAALAPYASFDVKKFMHAWISQPGFPALSSGKQQRFLVTGSTDTTKWPLPEIFDDMSGHYLINLSAKDFEERLAKFSTLSLEQRLRLLIDRDLLALTPAVASASLLGLLPKFSQEISPAVWEILLQVIGSLKLFCPEGTTEYADYQKYLQSIFEPRFKEICFDHLSSSEEIDLRSALLSVALYTEDPATLASLTALYQKDISKIDADLRSAVLTACLKTDEEAYYPLLLDLYKNTFDPELRDDLLVVLALHSRGDAHLAELLSLLEDTTVVRPQDHLYLFVDLLRNPRTHTRVLDWRYSHWDYLVSLTGDKSIEDYPRYAAATIRTAEEAKRFYDFFDPKKSIPVLTRTIEVAHTQIDARLALIAADGPAVRQQLSDLTEEKVQIRTPGKHTPDKKQARMAIVAGAVIEQGNKFLLIKEAKKEFLGKWNLPAGRIEAAETLFDGAKREIREECGLEVEFTGVCQVLQQIPSSAMVITFAAKKLAGSISVDGENSLDARWFTYEEIKDLEAKGDLRDPQIIYAIDNYRASHVAPLEVIQFIK